MFVATAVSFAAYFGAFGSTVKRVSSFVALGIALVLPPIVARITHGRYYIARTSPPIDGHLLNTCITCADHFDHLDMASCPFHDGPICSLCCSTDSTCRDMCKKR